MLQINGDTTWQALAYISGCAAEWRLWVQLLSNAHRLPLAPLHMAMETRAHFLISCERLGDVARQLNMVATAAAADRAHQHCLDILAAPINYDAHRLGQAVGHADRLIHTFCDEMKSRMVVTMASQHARFYADAAPFGDEVENAFPSTHYDIAEAAKCRALGRWTASVMHLMRVLEVGLRALARHHSVEPDSNWNTVLNQIEAKTREVGRKTYGKAEEQWAAEAATHLRFVKNAWRNHAMHPLEKYDEERAVAVFENSRSFMAHLATKLSE